MLVPVEWTEDGWYKLADGLDISAPIALPDGQQLLQKQYPLSDSFTGGELNPCWKFFGGYDAGRFELTDRGITIEGLGRTIADCSPMLRVPTDHSYRVQVELDIEGDAMGGMALFYNRQAGSGMLANANSILTNIKGWQFETEQNVIDRHVFLRLVNSHNIVNMYYSLDGENWTRTENSLEVSAFHHNVLGGFMSLRIGLCSIGKGRVTFRNFKYESLAD